MDGIELYFDSSHLLRVFLYDIYILDTHNFGSI